MLDLLIPFIGMAIAPSLAPFVLSAIGALFSYMLQALGLKYEILDTVGDKETTTALHKRISASAWGMSCHKVDDTITLGPGLFVDRKLRVVGWLVESNATTQHGAELNMTIHLICSPAARSNLFVQPDGTPQPRGKGKDCEIYGNPWSRKIYNRPVVAKLPIDIPAQISIAEKIADEIDVGCCALVYGPPGTGKTMIATRVAIMLRKAGRAPVVIRGYSPHNPGDSIYSILSRHTPSKKNPVIICLDEFDCLVDNILSGKVKAPGDFTIEAFDKASLAGLLDQLGNTPFLVVIATSNADLVWWGTPEREFVTRPGRFAIRIELPQLSADDAVVAFNSGMAHYNLAGAVPNFGGKAITAAQMAEAFKRSHGDIARVYTALGVAA